MSHDLLTPQQQVWDLVAKIQELQERKAVYEARWKAPENTGAFLFKVTYTSGEEKTYEFELNLGRSILSVEGKPVHLEPCPGFYLCPGEVRDFVICTLYIEVIQIVSRHSPTRLKWEETKLTRIETSLRAMGRTSPERSTKIFQNHSPFSREQTPYSLIRRLRDKSLRDRLLKYGYGVVKSTKPGAASLPKKKGGKKKSSTSGRLKRG